MYLGGELAYDIFVRGSVLFVYEGFSEDSCIFFISFFLDTLPFCTLVLLPKCSNSV